MCTIPLTITIEVFGSSPPLWMYVDHKVIMSAVNRWCMQNIQFGQGKHLHGMKQAIEK